MAVLPLLGKLCDNLNWGRCLERDVHSPGDIPQTLPLAAGPVNWAKSQLAPGRGGYT